MKYAILLALAGFVTAFLVGTFVEYIVHRMMHGRKLLARKHAEHHRDGWGQGVLGEFCDYFVGTLPVIVVAGLVCVYLLDSMAAAVGFAAGAVLYAILAAYAHQVQHERPELVFWLPRPVHHLHHKHHMWRHNFGILVDFWDRLFGTYKPMYWQPERRPRDFPLRAFFQVKWY